MGYSYMDEFLLKIKSYLMILTIFLNTTPKKTSWTGSFLVVLFGCSSFDRHKPWMMGS